MRASISCLILFYAVKAEIIVIYSRENTPILEEIRKTIKNQPLKEISYLELPDANSPSVKLFITIGNIAFTKTIEKVSLPVYFVLLRDPLINIPPNATGLTAFTPSAEDFRFISTVLPEIKRLGTVVPKNKVEATFVKDAIKAAGVYGLILKVVETEVGKVGESFQKLQDVDMIWLFPNEITISRAFIKYFVLQSLSKKIPLYGFTEEIVRAGAVLGSEVDTKGYISALKKSLRKIDEGRNPLTIPLQHPERILFIANLKTAKILKMNPKLEFFPDVRIIK